MKIATSYFYQLRFFKPNMIPISTAIWGPKWFKQGQGAWFDKNNVVNGLYCKEFSPGPLCEGLCHGDKNCIEKGLPWKCKFLETYEQQLKTSVNLLSFLERCEKISNKVKEINHYIGEPIIVLMVHESADNPCSERKVIQNYFKSYGINCQELEYPIE